MLISNDYSMKATHRRGCGNCLRYFTIVANFFLLLAGAAVAAVFIYLQVTQVDFVGDALGTPLITIADILMISAGCLLIVTAIIGLVSGCTRNLCNIATHFILLIPVLLALLAAIVCALVFKTWLTEPVRSSMRETIRTIYGTNLENSYNRRVTNSFDKCQLTWKCCASDDQGWYVYQQSSWYMDQPGAPGAGDNPKPYVPASCCVYDANGYISDADLRFCQTNTNGPPARRAGDQYAGQDNKALQYRGCYEASKDYMIYDDFSWFMVIIGLGSAVAFLVLIGIIISIAYCIAQRREITTYSYSATTTAESIQLTRKY